MPDISGALKVLIKPIEYIAKTYSEDCAEQLAQLRAHNNLKQLYTKLNATQKVKTIWNIDRPIAISTFYYPAKIIISPKKTIVAENIDDMGENAIVLQGVIGQGKSILLRYLLGKEIRGGERVPVFIELRNVKGDDLNGYIHNQFDELLSTAEYPRIFNLFAKEGKISLLLDGFDEVDIDQVSSMIHSIERLAQKYPRIKIVVTSRPNSGIESSAYFAVKRIAPLNTEDYWGFFSKVCRQDYGLALRITSALMAPTSHIRNLVRTPLLATLLTIVYRANQKIPSDFSEFYDELFQILLVRHDRAKPGFERTRRTKLSDRDLQHVFEAYCFKQKAQGLTSVSRSQALEIASASIQAHSLRLDEGDFLDDIIKITCLLQEEGGKIEYLHQSIQDYFSARYVASRPEEVAERFYTHIQDGSKRWPWEQVLKFLDQIDQYRSSEYFFIPALERTLRHLDSIEETAPVERLRKRTTDTISIRQTITTEDDMTSPSYAVVKSDFSDPYEIPELLSTIFQSVIDEPFSPEKKIWYKGTSKNLRRSLPAREICNRIGSVQHC